MKKYIIEELLEKGLENWNGKKHVKLDDNTIAFLKEYENLCRKYNLTISHEDGHGTFMLYDFKEDDIIWLCNAEV